MNLDTALQSDTFPSQLSKTGSFSVLSRTASSPFASLEVEEFSLHSSCWQLDKALSLSVHF